jgi:diguanylate cyclase (GGDEF)-like protein/PAS domain S-box-containing protein
MPDAPQPTAAGARFGDASQTIDGRLVTMVDPGQVVSSGAILALASVTAALRGFGPREVGVTELLTVVERALSGTAGNRCAVWQISRDGGRMRIASGGPPPWEPGFPADASWVPVDGPVSDVLTVGQSIEIGIAPDSGGTTSPRAKSFARVLPLRHRQRIVAVVGVVRDSPSPLFSNDDRIMLDAVAERIESAFATREINDALTSARTSPVRHADRTSISEDLFNRLSAVAGDVVFRHRFSSGTEYVSQGVSGVLGYTAAEFINDPGLARRIVHPEDRHLVSELAENTHASDEPLMLRTVSRDGTIVWQLVRVSPIVDGDRIIGVEGMSTDVTAMKRAEAELNHQARSDPLTNLANRLTFAEYAERSVARLIRHPGMMGVLYLDLTGFKNINDTLGHGAGDRAIVTIAERLNKVTRREDVVARIGGDEFAVLMPDLANIAEATATAQRIISAIESPIDIDGHPIRISTGVGISVSTNGTLSPEEMLRQADTALYQAKRAGRGRWQVFHGQSGTFSGPDQIDGENPMSQLPDLVTVGSIRAAFAAGDLRVHYHPIVSLTTGEADAVEALVRWDHPELGMLAAELFLDVAEEADLLHTIDDWVLAQASRELAGWRDRYGVRMRLAMNLASGRFATAGFLESVLSTLAANDLTPDMLTLELNEPAITDLSAAEVQQLESLSRAGTRIAVDRFGTGSASLRNLRRIPVHQIKLDTSLVSSLGDANASNVDEEIVKLAMQVAQSLGAGTTAVGVERVEQMHALRRLGCLSVQGHLVHPAESAERLIGRFVEGKLAYAGLRSTNEPT